MRKLFSLLFRAVLCVWQFPQTLIGFLLWLFCDVEYAITLHDSKGEDIKVHCMPLFGSGICLGEYIFIDTLRYERMVKGISSRSSFCRTVWHESGHRRQSRRLGFLYLFVIGIPSLAGNIYSRIKGKDSMWYYRQPWEAWADRLGGVDRTANFSACETINNLLK